MSCKALSILDRVDRVTKFIQFDVEVTIEVAEGTDASQLELIANKAEKNCLVSNSLTAETNLVVKPVFV